MFKNSQIAKPVKGNVGQNLQNNRLLLKSYLEILGLTSKDLNTDDISDGDKYSSINENGLLKLRIGGNKLTSMKNAVMKPAGNYASFLDEYRMQANTSGGGCEVLYQVIEHQVKICEMTRFNFDVFVARCQHDIAKLKEIENKLNVSFDIHNGIAQAFQRCIFELDSGEETLSSHGIICVLSIDYFVKLFGSPKIAMRDYGVAIRHQLVSEDDCITLWQILQAVYYHKWQQNPWDQDIWESGVDIKIHLLDSFFGYNMQWIKELQLKTFQKLNMSFDVRPLDVYFYEPHAHKHMNYGAWATKWALSESKELVIEIPIRNNTIINYRH